MSNNFDYLNEAVKGADVKQDNKTTSNERDKILINIPKDWKDRIKSNSAGMSVSAYMRLAVSRMMEKDGL